MKDVCFALIHDLQQAEGCLRVELRAMAFLISARTTS